MGGVLWVEGGCVAQSSELLSLEFWSNKHEYLHLDTTNTEQYSFTHIFNRVFFCPFLFSGQSRKAGGGDPLQRQLDLVISHRSGSRELHFT